MEPFISLILYKFDIAPGADIILLVALRAAEIAWKNFAEDERLDEDFPTETFEDRYEDEAQVNIDLRRALDLLQDAGENHKAGNINRAIELYRESLAFCPTADAHTHLGWMYRFQDRLEEVIEECHQAIKVDPDFGNPYNDIGCYLLELKQPDEAAKWFEKAKTRPTLRTAPIPLHEPRTYLHVPRRARQGLRRAVSDYPPRAGRQIAQTSVRRARLPCSIRPPILRSEKKTADPDNHPRRPLRFPKEGYLGMLSRLSSSCQASST